MRSVGNLLTIKVSLRFPECDFDSFRLMEAVDLSRHQPPVEIDDERVASRCQFRRVDGDHDAAISFLVDHRAPAVSRRVRYCRSKLAPEVGPSLSRS